MTDNINLWLRLVSLSLQVLLIFSALGAGLSLTVFGTFSYMVDHPHLDTGGFTHYKSIPLISFSLAIFFANCGILNLPFLVLAEILPLKIKAFGTKVCYSVWNITSFLVIKVSVKHQVFNKSQFFLIKMIPAIFFCLLIVALAYCDGDLRHVFGHLYICRRLFCRCNVRLFFPARNKGQDLYRNC